MDDRQVDERYLEIRRVRLKAFSQKSYIPASDIENFELLEDKMNAGELGEDWLRSFHLSNDDYLFLLQKMLKAAVKIGEPFAKEKLQDFIEEKGTQGPAVFLTPWDMTLADLDKTIGDFEEIAAFYGMEKAA